MSVGLATRGYLGGSSGSGITYRMRGYDTSLSRFVFWNATSVDGAGAEYAGPGPLVDIVVQQLLGA